MKPFITWCSVFSLLYVSLLTPVSNLYAGDDDGPTLDECQQQMENDYLNEEFQFDENDTDMSQSEAEQFGREKEAEANGEHSQDFTDSQCAGSGKSFSDAINTEEYIYTLCLGIAGVLAAIWFVTQCVKQPSAWIFMAAGLIFTIWEIINWATYSSQLEVSDRKLVALTNVKTEKAVRTQIESLELLIDDLEDAKAATEKRVEAYEVSGYFYLAAMIVAIVEVVLEIITTEEVKSSCVADASGPSLEIQRMAIMDSLKNNQYVYNTMLKLVETTFLPTVLTPTQLQEYYHPSDESFRLAYASLEYRRLQKGAIKSQSIDDFQKLSEYNMPRKKPRVKKEPWEKLASMSPELFLATAKAGDTGNADEQSDTMMGMGIGAAAVLLIGALIVVAFGITVSALAHGIVRAIIIIAWYIIQQYGLSIVEGKIPILEQNIEEVKMLIDQIRTRATVDIQTFDEGTQSTGAEQVDPNIVAPDAVTTTNNPTNTCVDVDSTPTGCPCGQCGTDCNCDVERYSPTGPIQANLDEALGADFFSDAENALDESANGNCGSGASAPPSSNEIAAMRKKRGLLMKKLNEVEKSNGKPQTNFKKEIKGQLAKIHKQAHKAFNDAGGVNVPGLNGFFGADSKTAAAGKGAKKDEKKAAQDKKELAKKGKGGGALIDFGDDGGRKKGKYAEADVKLEDAGKALDQYVLDEKDINDASGVSIFKLITRRYRKSAFQRLFTKKKTKAVKKKKASKKKK
jgi:hypothetical protein